MGFPRLAGVIVAVLFSGSVLAQAYPTKPVRLVISFTPGSSTDIIGRAVAAKLQEVWGQPVVAENRVGAGGSVGSAVVVKSAPDGYTLLANSSAHVANPGIYANMPYDTLKDFTNLALLGGGPNVLMVGNGVGWKALKEFVDAAKAAPGKLNFSSAGIGSGTHFNLEKLKIATGIDVVHVPYKGVGPALTALLGNEVSALLSTFASALPHVKAGRLRALGVTSRTEAPQLPGVPPIASAVPGFENSGWFGIVAPRGTPKDIIQKVYLDTKKALEDPAMKEKFFAQGLAPVGNSPEEMGRAMKAESELWKNVVQARKIQVK